VEPASYQTLELKFITHRHPPAWGEAFSRGSPLEGALPLEGSLPSEGPSWDGPNHCPRRCRQVAEGLSESRYRRRQVAQGLSESRALRCFQWVT